MATARTLSQARRVGVRVHRTLGEDVRRLREDAGLTRAALGDAAGVDPTYLARIEDGLAHPTMDWYGRLATALGADLAAHLYPNTGPAIRDRHQARILEWLLGQCHSRWSRFPEVAVRKPARGWIDLVLHDRDAACVVAAEIQSSIGRLEQMLRWSGEKAASLPSWEGWARFGVTQTVSTLLIVRRTRATSEVGKDFAHQLQAAYPAHPDDAIAALTGTRAWPGPTLIWVDVTADAIRFVHRR
jgi:transcriptional regulator with XRE-family HTH domain